MFLNKISLFFTLLIVVYKVDCAYPDPNVPVFIWGSKNAFANPSSLPPLTHVPKQQFSNELDKVLKKDVSLVLFVDEKLSPEDFQCTLDDQSCFKNLMSYQNTNEFLYFPSVESPAEIVKSRGNVEIVTLDDKVTESRQQLLAEHDNQMQEKITSLQNANKDFVVVYTAKNPSLHIQSNHRVTRQASNSTADDKVNVHQLDGVLLAFSKLTVYTNAEKDGKPIIPTSVTSKDYSDENVKQYEVKIEDATYILKLNVTMKSGYWSVTSINFKDSSETHVMRSSVDIAGVGDFSFHCAPMIRFTALGQSSGSYIIVGLSALQIQPFREKPQEYKFGDSLDCVGFMSAPILAGLFVTFMLAAIVALGICMMMDLKTMDRFEDPKGKTITVTATE
ncbi:uncharacterized protein LOC113377552 [Ctenocephalides felis]|uniref:uncharacterized protein LOC113376947 n=1 Tax=Ctenocephalides felis TaxID=7515 RepID=UPI000E6E3545|nr:uncharacterized protein LOC113376947 [Ctenocephalides felis]XP_026473697.1 uncharacterized protein LOC113377552 [Ctenocephalides felis]